MSKMSREELDEVLSHRTRYDRWQTESSLNAARTQREVEKSLGCSTLSLPTGLTLLLGVLIYIIFSIN